MNPNYKTGFSYQQWIEGSQKHAEIAKICSESIQEFGLNKATKMALEGKLPNLEITARKWNSAKSYMHKMRKVHEAYGGLVGFWALDQNGNWSYHAPWITSYGVAICLIFGEWWVHTPIVKVRSKWLGHSKYSDIEIIQNMNLKSKGRIF